MTYEWTCTNANAESWNAVAADRVAQGWELVSANASVDHGVPNNPSLMVFAFWRKGDGPIVDAIQSTARDIVQAIDRVEAEIRSRN